MCLIIDSCTVPSVFDSESKDHARFVPVLEWVTIGSGKIIYGGTKYNGELARLKRYLKLIVELSKQGRAIKVPNEPVDDYAATLKTRVPDTAFNDEHIVALVAISRCCVVCTNDRKAHPYLQDKGLYPRKLKPPKIYSAASHFRLCCDKNIVGACKGKQ